MIGQMGGIDTHQLRQSLRARHKPDHVVGSVMRVDHQRSAGRHSAHIIPALDHRSFHQNDDVRVIVFVSQLILDNVIADAAIFAGGSVRAIWIVNVILHRLRILALDASGGGDRVDDIAAFLIHDDAARPNRKFRITHIQTSSVFGLPRSDSRTVMKSLRRTANGRTRLPSSSSAIANSVAFLHKLSISAPVEPSIRPAKSSKSTSEATGTRWQQSRRMAARTAASGFANGSI